MSLEETSLFLLFMFLVVASGPAGRPMGLYWVSSLLDDLSVTLEIYPVWGVLTFVFQSLPLMRRICIRHAPLLKHKLLFISLDMRFPLSLSSGLVRKGKDRRGLKTKTGVGWRIWCWSQESTCLHDDGDAVDEMGMGNYFISTADLELSWSDPWLNSW